MASSVATAVTIGGLASTVVVTDQVDVEQLAEVYRQVHAADLHLPDHRVPSVRDRLRWTAEAPGFQAALGYVDGRLAGAVLGCPLPPETLWWRDLSATDDPDLALEWAGRTFAVCEAFVLPEHRRHRLGLRMTTQLLAGRREERVALAVAETNTRVWHALQRIRFDHVGDLVPFPGWRSHRMLVRSLPLSPTA
ncbi:GNAT family N-acetyltransferase [Micromonospora sp. NPDC000442]|uniref:GNAT family N-acetyltransferase n=1 Tax=Micromonospora sp. NPDC000442 TaxID=3364217 RepID=UPI00368C1F9C